MFGAWTFPSKYKCFNSISDTIVYFQGLRERERERERERDETRNYNVLICPRKIDISSKKENCLQTRNFHFQLAIVKMQKKI